MLAASGVAPHGAASIKPAGPAYFVVCLGNAKIGARLHYVRSHAPSMITLQRLLVCVAMIPIAAIAGDPGHCAIGETVVFSCGIGANKVASICVAPKSNKHREYLQYRYGVLGKPEILLPAIDQAPGFNTDAMAYINPLGDGNGYIRFRSGRYSYIAYAFSSRASQPADNSAPGWDNWYGVAIERDDKVLKLLHCNRSFGLQSEINPSFLAKHVNFLALSDDNEKTLDRLNDKATRSKPD